MSNPIVHLKIERRSNHPWIFQKMVEKPDPRPKPGSIVDIIDREGTFAGRGFYNGHSRIALRVLTANASDTDLLLCMEAGMNDFLAKPLSLHALGRALDSWRKHAS